MASSSGELPPYDADAQTGRALGAFFGMVAFNLILVAIAFILRRVTRPKPNGPSNSVELENGRYNRKESNAKDDIEKGPSVPEATRSNGQSTKEFKDTGKTTQQAAEKTPSGDHDNGGFVDVDLEYEVKVESDGVYESRNKSQTANRENDYSNLKDVKVEMKSDDTSQDYENFQRDKIETQNSEAGVFY